MALGRVLQMPGGHLEAEDTLVSLISIVWRSNLGLIWRTLGCLRAKP